MSRVYIPLMPSRTGYEKKKRGANTRTSQEVTHPSTTLAPSTLNFGVLMGSGCISAGMIAPVMSRVYIPLMPSPAGMIAPVMSRVYIPLMPSPYGVRKKKRGCNTRTSQQVTHPSTTLPQARLTSEFLMGSGALVLYYSRPSTLNFGVLMGSGAFSAGMIAPVMSRVYIPLMPSPAGMIAPVMSRVYIPLMPSPYGVRKKKRGATRGPSQEVTHPSTTLAQARLTSGVLMGSGALVLV
ncbi:hypothetical protein G2W53_009270 [Senna tora]|uniref:Uncharacterized protein n=1 Tax=Senna tora TaxID=362788 RepID=A0A834WXP8_9FABA|nr:hypothetical protein G2W53_009270 [Senna tora]